MRLKTKSTVIGDLGDEMEFLKMLLVPEN